MKTQISRHSDQPARHYTGVYQQQGRMLVDADANEQMEIVKRRLAETVSDIVDAGAPRYRGVVDLSTQPPQLRFGHVYVDGLHTQLTPTTGDPAADVYSHQADFPSPPELPPTPHLLYVDLWERPVLALEDEEFADPALHGADTCTRTLAMAQLKWCPKPTTPGALPACLNVTLNPPIGDATLTVALRGDGGAPSADPCDPCALEITPADRIGNYVFRLEVHHVEGPPSNPTRIVLKWSSENGSEAYAVDDMPPDFAGDEWIYEHYDTVAEHHLGVHLAPGFVPRRGLLTRGLADADGPFVRRWDGAAELTRQGTEWTLAEGPVHQPGHADATLAAIDRGIALDASLPTGTIGSAQVGDALVATLGRLTLTLALADKRFVAGDHWLVTVRERAEESRRARVVTPTPLGIVHRVLLLGEATGANGVIVDPSSRRRLSFPSLTDLTADTVGYTPPAIELLEDADTVQEALDRLQGLNAGHVAFADPDCQSGLLSTAHTVEEALEAICAITAGHVGYSAGQSANSLAAASTVQSALDTLGEQLGADSGVCAATLALFGRGVLSGAVPSVGAVRSGELTASITPGTLVNGRGCLLATPALTATRTNAVTGDLWLYIVDPPDQPPKLEFRATPPVPLFDDANSGGIVEAMVNPPSGPAVSQDANSIKAYTQAWGVYQKVPAPPELEDGAVCLGRIGIQGDIAWISPDDREQLFPTPALLITHWRAQRRHVHDEMRAAYTAGDPVLLPLERGDGAPLHGSAAMADGRQYTGVVRLGGPVRGQNPLVVQLVASASLIAPASVSIAPGATTAAFTYTVATGNTALRAIDAKVGGTTPQTQHADITAVRLNPLSGPGAPIAGVSTLLTVALSAPAPHAVQLALAVDGPGISLAPATLMLNPGQLSANAVMTAADGATTARTVTATVGSLSVSKSVTPRALSALSRGGSSVALDGTQVTRGGTLNATVRLSGAADMGATIYVTAQSGLTVPGSVTIPAGATSADFTITAGTSLGAKAVTVRLGAQTITATVTVVAPKGKEEDDTKVPPPYKEMKDTPHGGIAIISAFPEGVIPINPGGPVIDPGTVITPGIGPVINPGIGGAAFVTGGLRPDLQNPGGAGGIG